MVVPIHGRSCAAREMAVEARDGPSAMKQRGRLFATVAVALACACGVPAGTPAGGTPVVAGVDAARLVGRFDVRGPRSARFAWSGSTFEVRFVGGALAARLTAPAPPSHAVEERSTAYAVSVDGAPPRTLEVVGDDVRVVLARDVDPRRAHTVRVVREAEASAGVHDLRGFELPEGGRFLPVPRRRLSLEVVGDSITCGYGVLGRDAHCPFTYATERATSAYGALVGEALDADVTTLCWSGRGVRRNYDGTTEETMPVLFGRALPEPPGIVPWSFADPPPDAVIVALGTNDFLSPKATAEDLPALEDAYAAFLARVREARPRARVVVLTSPMLAPEPSRKFGPTPLRALAGELFRRVVARRHGAGDDAVDLVDVGWQGDRVGCDFHPAAAVHRAMAQVVAAHLRTVLGSR